MLLSYFLSAFLSETTHFRIICISGTVTSFLSRLLYSLHLSEESILWNIYFCSFWIIFKYVSILVSSILSAATGFLAQAYLQRLAFMIWVCLFPCFCERPAAKYLTFFPAFYIFLILTPLFLSHRCWSSPFLVIPPTNHQNFMESMWNVEKQSMAIEIYLNFSHAHSSPLMFIPMVALQPIHPYQFWQIPPHWQTRI